MRFIYILRCPIEQIKTNEHARNSSALPALSGVQWASRVLTLVRLLPSASLRSRTFIVTDIVARWTLSAQHLVKNEAMNRLYFGEQRDVASSCHSERSRGISRHFPE